MKDVKADPVVLEFYRLMGLNDADKPSSSGIDS
jgi:hypothetical protein